MCMPVFLKAREGRTGVPPQQENVSLDTGQVGVGQRAGQAIPPGVFWRSRLAMDEPNFLKFNISIHKNALIGVYGRKGLPPTHTQYDFVELLDGSRLIVSEDHPQSVAELQEVAERPVAMHEAGFFHYLDSGVWHLAFYNDGRATEQVSYRTNILAACPVLCSGNGQYTRGRCECHSGWKGTECDIPISQCVDLQCGGHGVCVHGTCVCNAGYRGESCDQGGSDGVLAVDCADPICSGHGLCLHGRCHCAPGWSGPSCQAKSSTCPADCSGHGTFQVETETCLCEPGYTGPDCSSEVCEADCAPRGVCVGGSCHCEKGWTGPQCEEQDCDPPCGEHGVCQDAMCECHPGWAGESCSIDGCPGLCNSNGRCTLDHNSWHCLCQAGWRGAGCDVAMETICADGKDNEGGENEIEGMIDSFGLTHGKCLERVWPQWGDTLEQPSFTSAFSITPLPPLSPLCLHYHPSASTIPPLPSPSPLCLLHHPSASSASTITPLPPPSPFCLPHPPSAFSITLLPPLPPPSPFCLHHHPSAFSITLLPPLPPPSPLCLLYHPSASSITLLHPLPRPSVPPYLGHNPGYVKRLQNGWD
ncbi:hypothetical protein ACEWY4_016111 [Coilia grayii]|uniref:EGF-like domain-containing protein n=1 Tax=Coilia grayii TaxID=363190 RepID=A0ABD1JQS1_9TELE